MKKDHGGEVARVFQFATQRMPASESGMVLGVPVGEPRKAASPTAWHIRPTHGAPWRRAVRGCGFRRPRPRETRPSTRTRPCHSPLFAPRNPTLGILHQHTTTTPDGTLSHHHLTTTDLRAYLRLRRAIPRKQAGLRHVAARLGTRISRNLLGSTARLQLPHRSRREPPSFSNAARHHRQSRREKCARVPSAKSKSLRGARDKDGGK